MITTSTLRWYGEELIFKGDPLHWTVQINNSSDLVFGIPFHELLAETVENYIDYLDYKLGRLPERYTNEPTND